MGEKNGARLKISRTKDESRAREKKGAPKKTVAPNDKNSRQGKNIAPEVKKYASSTQCLYLRMCFVPTGLCTPL